MNSAWGDGTEGQSSPHGADNPMVIDDEAQDFQDLIDQSQSENENNVNRCSRLR